MRLGVRDGRIEHLVDVPRSRARHEPQRRARLRHAQAADLADDSWALRGAVRTQRASARNSVVSSLDHAQASSPASCGHPRGRGISASERTRRACGRPSTRSRTPACASCRCGRRSCARPSPGRLSTSATRCAPSASSPDAFMASTRAIRRCSTNGPFLLDLLIAITLALLAAATAADDQAGRIPCACGACACRASGRPRGSPDGGRPWTCPRRRRAGGRRGSSPSHARTGRLPSQRLRPALPLEMFSWSTLPTWPTVARQTSGTRRISPDGRRSTAYVSSLPTSWMPDARAPRELTAAAGLQLDVVDDGAGRDVRERQRVAWADVGCGAGLDGLPDLERAGARM